MANFFKKLNTKFSRFSLLLVSILAVLLSVYFGSVNFFTLILYLASIFLCFQVIKYDVLPRTFNKPEHGQPKKRVDLILIVSLIILQIIFLQYFSHFPSHSHWDEYITAKISYSLPSVQEINWFAGFPRDKSQWVSQFPIVFFILQKPILFIFGPSVESIRLSTLPYSALIIVFLYLLSLELFNRRVFAAVSTATFAFFAPNLYLSSLGLHFISSTFFFLASFYYFVRLYKTEQKKYSLLCGIFAGLGYLTYASSYITLPLLVSFAILETLWQRSFKKLKLMVPAAIIFLVIMLPFVFFAFTKENFFMQRINQVDFFSGEWSYTKDKIKTGESLHLLLKKQFATSLKSLYKNDIGGAGGYNFGHKALFEPLTLILIIIGSLLCIFQGFVLKNRTALYVLIAILASFILGMVFSVPLGAFHRFSIAFPLIAIVIAMTIDSAAQLGARIFSWRFTIPALSILFLLVFAYFNFNAAIEMIKADRLPDTVPLATFMQNNYPENSTFVIAAFPAYGLERELFFRVHNKYEFVTDYHKNIFPRVNDTPVVILLNDMPLIKENWPQLPNGTTIDTIGDIKLREHVIFLPDPLFQQLSDKDVHVTVLFNSSKEIPANRS